MSLSVQHICSQVVRSWLFDPWDWFSRQVSHFPPAVSGCQVLRISPHSFVPPLSVLCFPPLPFILPLLGPAFSTTAIIKVSSCQVLRFSRPIIRYFFWISCFGFYHKVQYKCCIIWYKALHGLAPVSIFNFCSRVPTITERHSSLGHCVARNSNKLILSRSTVCWMFTHNCTSICLELSARLYCINVINWNFQNGTKI